MANGVKYLIMTVVFLAMVKLLQVTVFDGKKYDAYQKEEDRKYAERLQKKNSKEKPKPVKLGTAKKNDTQNKENTASEIDLALQNLKETYLSGILENLPSDGLRKDIFIRYYRHNKDGIGVYKLQEIGYYIHQKPATETAGLGSNIIYYGDEVPVEDIQIVALTLVKEGIPLKSIQHTKFEWKSSAIEIGTDIELIDAADITIKEIKEFERQY